MDLEERTNGYGGKGGNQKNSVSCQPTEDSDLKREG